MAMRSLGDALRCTQWVLAAAGVGRVTEADVNEPESNATAGAHGAAEADAASDANAHRSDSPAVDNPGAVDDPGADPGAGTVIDVSQAVLLLKTSRPTLYRWLRTGRIKAMKVGRQWRFYRHDIERFLQGEQPRIEPVGSFAPLIEHLAEHLKQPKPAGDDVTAAVNMMIQLGIASRTSDIHIEPWDLPKAAWGDGSGAGPGEPEADLSERAAVLRYRVDGVLHAQTAFDIRLLPAVVDRLKTLSACDLNEKIKPQDGRISIRFDDREFDLRVCFLPSLIGEAVTMRMLDRNVVILSLDRIDYAPADRERLDRAIAAPWGLVCIGGPIGSGKTTVLYACVQALTRPANKVVTIEDPVEYLIPGTVQVPIRPDAGVTFATAMRATFRSDPDVIMIGEIRDGETLNLAHEAAMTGHLVLTTLHFNEAAAGLQRMVDLGVPPFVVAGATKLIVAQRLVRLLCPHCAKPVTPPDAQLRRAEQLAREGGLDWAALELQFHQAAGCDQCNQLGYRGRNVIAEAMVMSPKVAAAMQRGEKAERLRDVAVEHGMTTIAADAVRRAAAGRTSLDEVFRVLS